MVWCTYSIIVISLLTLLVCRFLQRWTGFPRFYNFLEFFFRVLVLKCHTEPLTYDFQLRYRVAVWFGSKRNFLEITEIYLQIAISRRHPLILPIRKMNQNEPAMQVATIVENMHINCRATWLPIATMVDQVCRYLSHHFSLLIYLQNSRTPEKLFY